ncbi:MAG: CvpA family protein [Clostridia bacterium]|nr:CvpA family protein [Clostridia bacterium]
MSIAIDVILIGIVLILAFIGYKRGFVSAVMKLAAFVLAQVGAYFLYPVPADIMYKHLFLPKISSIIENAIRTECGGKSLAELFEGQNDIFFGILDRFSTVERVEEFYNTALEKSISAISAFMAEPIARGISDVLAFLAVFVVLLVLLILLGRLIDRLCDLPVLKTANAALGSALGAVSGLALVWVIAAVLGTAMPLLGSAFPELFGSFTVEETIVLKLLYSFNPLTIFNLL